MNQCTTEHELTPWRECTMPGTGGLLKSALKIRSEFGMLSAPVNLRHET